MQLLYCSVQSALDADYTLLSLRVQIFTDKQENFVNCNYYFGLSNVYIITAHVIHTKIYIRALWMFGNCILLATLCIFSLCFNHMNNFLSLKHRLSCCFVVCVISWLKTHNNLFFYIFFSSPLPINPQTWRSKISSIVVILFTCGPTLLKFIHKFHAIWGFLSTIEVSSSDDADQLSTWCLGGHLGEHLVVGCIF